MSKAVFTMLYSADYLEGALVVASCVAELKPADSEITLGILIDGQAFSRRELEQVLRHYSHVIDISPIKLSCRGKLVESLHRPELSKTLSKVLLWGLEYETVLYLDCDTLPNTLRASANVLDLLNLRFPLCNIAACPDSGFPDTFNSGVLVLHPNKRDYDNLYALACLETAQDHTFDGADQGLLNQYYNANPDWITGAVAGKESVCRWTKLPFLYNVTFSCAYQYAPAFEYFTRLGGAIEKQSQIKLLHYIGRNKPWHKSHNFGELGHLWTKTYEKYFGERIGYPAPLFPKNNATKFVDNSLKLEERSAVRGDEDSKGEVKRYGAGRKHFDEPEFEIKPYSPIQPPFTKSMERLHLEPKDECNCAHVASESQNPFDDDTLSINSKHQSGRSGRKRWPDWDKRVERDTECGETPSELEKKDAEIRVMAKKITEMEGDVEKMAAKIREMATHIGKSNLEVDTRANRNGGAAECLRTGIKDPVTSGTSVGMEMGARIKRTYARVHEMGANIQAVSFKRDSEIRQKVQNASTNPKNGFVDTDEQSHDLLAPIYENLQPFPGNPSGTPKPDGDQAILKEHVFPWEKYSDRPAATRAFPPERRL